MSRSRRRRAAQISHRPTDLSISTPAFRVAAQNEARATTRKKLVGLRPDVMLTTSTLTTAALQREGFALIPYLFP